MPIHTERQHLPYTAAQLFDLVADVEHYPEFMPWVVAAHIRRREHQTVFVDMTIGSGPLRRRFSTAAVLHRPDRIDITSNDQLFRHFLQRWTFATGATGGTDLEYRVDFELRSGVLQALLAAVLAGQIVATIAAFRRRANELYGLNERRRLMRPRDAE